MRAIEHRKYFLRCTSHGVSGLIDPIGELTIELPLMIDGAAYIAVPRVRATSTTYSNNGALIEILLTGFPFCILGVSLLRQFTGRRELEDT